MNKILFPLVAILLLAACSSSEDTINEPEPPKYQIDSAIPVGDLKLQAYIFEGDYYIEAIDESGNKVFTIKDKAESYTHDLGFGDKREYIVKGCFLQSALQKDDHLYILVSLYADMAYHPHKFILKIKDGKVLKKEYFDKEYYYGFEQTIFYPEALADWYGEYVAIYKTVRTGIYEIGLLDSDLKQTIGNNDSGAEIWVKEIEKNNYMPISYSNMVYIYDDSMVRCVDISKYGYNKYLIWQVPITDEEIRVNKSTYSLDGNNVVVDIDATTRAGEKKKYHLVLNKATGELVNPQS